MTMRGGLSFASGERCEQVLTAADVGDMHIEDAKLRTTSTQWPPLTCQVRRLARGAISRAWPEKERWSARRFNVGMSLVLPE